ncbi:EamA family transporter [Nocardioides bruguierae]|uniref:EamA family transporter n=1 Tax=Nocardioides bruguierae TaxID=2945102 RepID=UPI00202199B5|nr:EamA family transporter [Nocardioides bruguierae]MCL8025328.1 EamA family transporter [Nocardioides bruguierae]
MPLRDRLLGLLVAVLWGLGFPATSIALDHYPPFLLGALRCLVVAVPTMLLVPRPQVPFTRVVAIGFSLGVVQFGLVYLALAAGMPAGLASLLIQLAAPLTVVLGAVLLRERVTRRQVVGLSVALAALGVIAVHRASVAPVLPIVLTVLGAAGWALGNVATRWAAAPQALHLTLWWSVVPVLPLLVLSLTVEGPAMITETLGSAFSRETVPSDLAFVYVCLGSTVGAYALWSLLLSRHDSARVAPFGLLVPVFGLLSSWAVLGEAVEAIVVAAGAVVLAAVAWSSRADLPPDATRPDVALLPVVPPIPEAPRQDAPAAGQPAPTTPRSAPADSLDG